MATSKLTESIRIPQNNSNGDQPRHEVSRSFSTSTSPDHHRKFSFGVSDGQQSYGTSPNLRRTVTGPQPKQLKPFREQDIKILLLENVNQTGRDILKGQGYQVEALKSSLPEDQLIEKIKYVQTKPLWCPSTFPVILMKYFGCKYHRPVLNAHYTCCVDVFRCLPSDLKTTTQKTPHDELRERRFVLTRDPPETSTSSASAPKPNSPAASSRTPKT